jgi:hypothetical protein
MTNADKVEAIINNEKEWRKFLMEEVKDIKTSQVEMKISISNLQLKVAFFGAVFGAIGAMFASFVKEKL